MNILPSNTLSDYVLTIKCFICDRESINTLNCDNFDPSNSSFAKECPIDTSGGCSITKKEGTVKYSCSLTFSDVFLFQGKLSLVPVNHFN